MTCTVTDVAGGTALDAFTVTVTNTRPTITVPEPFSVNATSPAGAVVTFTATGHDAEDGALTPVCTPASGVTFAYGATTVSCTVTDVTGATATDTFTVTVTNTPPTVTVPANIAVVANQAGGAVVTFTATGADDQDGVLTPVCAPASGSLFALGSTTTVTCSVADGQGLTDSDSFTVTVTNTPPTITAPTPISVNATSPAGAAVSFATSGNDAEDGALVPTCTAASGATFAYGATTVSCTVTDVTGATATDTFTVTVTNTPPSVTVPANIAVTTASAGGRAVSFTATGSDAQDGALTPVCVPASGANFPVGTTLVTCTVTDTRAATASFSVTVTLDVPVNRKPVAVNDAYTGQWNTLLTVPVNGVLGNDSDPDGNALTSIKLTNPASGVLVLNLNGSLTYMPAANFAGVATFTYKANDGLLDSNAATVKITITSPCPSRSHDGKSRDGNSRDGKSNHTRRSDDKSSDDKSNDGSCRPGTPVSHSDHYTTKKNSPLAVALNKGVLKNDGALAATAQLIAGANHGTVVLAANGTFLYTPAANFVGNDAFYYVARSAAGVAGKVVKASIRVRGHWDGDGCDHDKKKNKHKKGDKCDHERDHD